MINPNLIWWKKKKKNLMVLFGFMNITEFMHDIYSNGKWQNELFISTFSLVVK